MAAEKTELGLIAGRADVLGRCKKLCAHFNYTIQTWADFDGFLASTAESPRVIIAFAADAASKEAAAECAQVARYKFQESFVICVVANRLSPEDAAFVKKSGANLILLEDEFFRSSKLEYACTQVIRADFLPIKVADLAADRPVLFDVFHLLPLRRKFLCFAREGEVLTREKLKKAAEVGELYIRRSSADAFAKYGAANVDRSAAGLARRCRSQFLALYASCAEMAFLLTDQSEYSSYEEGEALLKKCRGLADELMITLGEFGNAWEIVNNATIGEFGSAERAPAVAAYAALFGLVIELPDIADIMIAALLADLGLLLLSPAVTEKVRAQQLDAFTREEREEYEEYPRKSLEIVLSRKLPVAEKLRELMLCANERADGTGFPRRLPSNKIPEGAQLIHFCREFDRRTLVVLGRARVDREEVRRRMIEEESLDPRCYSPVLMVKLRKAFVQ